MVKGLFDEKNMVPYYVFENVFDDNEYVKKGNSALGYVNNLPVELSTVDNLLMVNNISFPNDETIDIICERLADFPCRMNKEYGIGIEFH
jgi:hypothetical protein